jgi:GAF domain-containing protein
VTGVGERKGSGAENGPQRLVVFDEEIVLDPPLVELLAEIERRLQSLAARFGPSVPPGERFELLDSALDEIESALERVRGARSKLARIELRLVAAYERALAGLREVERASGTDKTS